MSAGKYRQLVDEIDIIAEKVKQFPESLQEAVYNTLVNTLLDMKDVQTEVSVDDARLPESFASISGEGTEDKRYSSAEIKEDYEKYRLDERNDMELAAYVAHYYISQAPSGERVGEINESHYKKMCKVTGRKLPKRAGAALNNAKNNRGYLKSTGKGSYALTDAGEHFVEHTLLKEND